MKPDRQAQAPHDEEIRHPPPLHCLLAFEAAARNLSLAKAAGELRLSTSALAQSIATLEDRLGLKLVRGLVPVVALTEAGEAYLRTVQAFSTRLRDGLFERFPIGRTQLRITAPQALSRLWLAPRIGDFVRAHPGIDLILSSTERFLPLHGGGVDVAIRYGGDDEHGLVSLPLWTDRLVAAAAPALAARADALSPAEIACGMPLIDHPAASWQRWLGGIDAQAAAPRALVTCADLHLAIEAALLGIGVVIAPARILAAKTAARALVIVSTHSVPARPYRAVVAPAQRERLAVRQFLAWLAAQADGAASAQRADA